MWKPQKEYILLLVGKTGAGKSTSGNTILGKKLLKTGMRFGAVTEACEWHVHTEHGRKFKIMDSPGLYDPKKTHEEIGASIVKAVTGMYPGPNAILYVIRIGRYTEEEFGTYQRLKCMFDEDITRYMIVLFTGGDELEEGKTLQQMLDEDSPEQLQQVLNECNNRYVVFNNMASDKQPQVKHLLSLIDEMRAENEHQHYTCPTYAALGQELEKEVARRLEEQEKEELKQKKCVMKQEQRAEEAEQDAKYTEMRSQQNEQEMQKRVQAEMEKVQKEVIAGGSVFRKLLCIVYPTIVAGITFGLFSPMTAIAAGATVVAAGIGKAVSALTPSLPESNHDDNWSEAKKAKKENT